MKGGEFLLSASSSVFSPELFTEEHRAVAKTARQFWENEVVPHLPQVHKQDFALLKKLVRKSAELGLTGVLVPEEYGGMEMDLTSMMIVAQELSRDGSYAVCHGAQTGIGALPLLLFGSAEQKARYLSRLVEAEIFPAYALTEPHAGSDALGARTRADLAAEGSHYILNGQKMWITNGGFADLFTVFAKVGGEQFTAFLVERSWAGVSSGAEEAKMGLKGSSTTAVFFDNVKVPTENLIGEIGRGHLNAFNVLNVGRLVLGAMAGAEAREAFQHSLDYAKSRIAFGKPIAQFGLIAQKLAAMSARMYVSESMLWRVIGMIEERLEGFQWSQPDAGKVWMKAVEEYAAECSLVKIFASEMLDFVVDEGVQIHGGYGYHQEYAIERAYRDSRINRIFEGTNEINRLVATGMLLKRAQRGELPLPAAVKALDTRPSSDPIENAKKIALLLFGAAYKAFGGAIDQQQEVVAGISDVLMYTFAMESATIRARKAGQRAADLAQYFRVEAMQEIARAAHTVLCACGEDLGVLAELARAEPINTVALGQKIAATS